MFSRLAIRVLAVLAILLPFGLMSVTAHAHESRNVGNYRLTVGFVTEPAIDGQKNGVDLRVRLNTAELPPVTGVEDALQVEITHIPSNTSKVFPIRTIFNDPGHYTVDLIATAPGQYRFRFFGDIEGLPVNETFTSGPGTFGDVVPAAELQFPQPVPGARELGAALGHIEEENHALESAATRNTWLSIAGMVLGAAGIFVGGVALGKVRK